MYVFTITSSSSGIDREKKIFFFREIIIIIIIFRGGYIINFISFQYATMNFVFFVERPPP